MNDAECIIVLISDNSASVFFMQGNSIVVKHQFDNEQSLIDEISRYEGDFSIHTVILTSDCYFKYQCIPMLQQNVITKCITNDVLKQYFCYKVNKVRNNVYTHCFIGLNINAKWYNAVKCLERYNDEIICGQIVLQSMLKNLKKGFPKCKNEHSILVLQTQFAGIIVAAFVDDYLIEFNILDVQNEKNPHIIAGFIKNHVAEHYSSGSYIMYMVVGDDLVQPLLSCQFCSEINVMSVLSVTEATIIFKLDDYRGDNFADVLFTHVVCAELNGEMLCSLSNQQKPVIKLKQLLPKICNIAMTGYALVLLGFIVVYSTEQSNLSIQKKALYNQYDTLKRTIIISNKSPAVDFYHAINANRASPLDSINLIKQRKIKLDTIKWNMQYTISSDINEVHHNIELVGYKRRTYGDAFGAMAAYAKISDGVIEWLR